MTALLQPRPLVPVDKSLLNTNANSILQAYERTRQKEVYKPLLVIIMSLICENHFMSA
jgi:hypothetical protein